MDCVLVWVIALLGDLIRHVVDGDNQVKQRDDDENQKAKGEVVEERVEIDVLAEHKDDADDEDRNEDSRSHHPLADPETAFTESADVIAEHGTWSLRWRHKQNPEMDRRSPKANCAVLRSSRPPAREACLDYQCSIAESS